MHFLSIQNAKLHIFLTKMLIFLLFINNQYVFILMNIANYSLEYLNKFDKP